MTLNWLNETTRFKCYAMSKQRFELTKRNKKERKITL